MAVDLHLHTSCSDGIYSPGELVVQAGKLGLSAIAITDHDTVEGVGSAVKKGTEIGIEVVAGIELSVAEKLPPGGHLHLLGYFIDYRNKDLLETLEFLRNERQKRVKKIIARLADLGIVISYDEIQQQSGNDNIGRPHIASVLLSKNIVENRREAFEKYLGKGAPAYVDKVKLNAADAIQLVKKTGGLAFLAHPVLMNMQNDKDLMDKIIELKRLGLDGVEVCYPMQSEEYTSKLSKITDSLSLAKSGGSDFHGYNSRKERLNHLNLDDGVLVDMKEYYKHLNSIIK